MEIYDKYNPVVSIVMPTYNRVSYLKRSIESVLNQSYKEWELIIVDDGSDDNSFQLINQYLMKYSNIRYMKHQNKRPVLTINTGLQAAVGKYVTILCSDDEFKKNHLELRVEYMQKHSLIDFIHGGVEIVGDPYVKDKDDLTKKVHLDQCAIGGTFFGKRSVFKEVRGFKKVRHGGDANLLERVSEKYKVDKVDYKTYVYYKDTPDSITNNI